MKPKLRIIIGSCALASVGIAFGDTIAYWRFEGNGVTPPTAGTQIEDSNGRTTTTTGVGIRAIDSSGNGNTIWAWEHAWAGHTYESGVPWSIVPQNGAPNGFFAKNSGDYPALFTWSNQSSPTGVNLDTWTSLTWTIEASFYTTALGNYRTVVGREGNGVETANASAAPVYFQMQNNNRFRIAYADASGVVRSVEDSSATLTTNQWYHYAATCDGLTLKLYRKGPADTAHVLAGSLDVSASANAALINPGNDMNGQPWGWTVGRGRYGTNDDPSQNHGDRWFGGIDEVRISNVALDPSLFIASPNASDSDNDGLPNLWETAYGLDPNDNGSVIPNNGASGDPDNDGFTNLEEFEAGSLPNSIASVPGDIDGDGLGDTWETSNFGSLAAGPTEDPDGDLANNLAEFTNSTIPTNGTSWPDTDSDSMNDAWETALLGDLSKDGTADTDGDGYTDLQEHDAHTNPSLATGTGVSPIWAALKNRWSFNGNLTDSVGGSNATIVEVGANDVFQGPASILLTGGAKAASDYVSLGSNLLPNSTTPVTIELWAKQNSIQNWSRIFDFHSSTAEYLMMAWTQGANNASDQVELVDGGVASANPNKNQPYGTTDEYHIVMTLEPLAGTSGTMKVTFYSAVSSAADLGAPKGTIETTINLVNLNDALNALGYSPWPDNTANATYNEVRIWNGALFGWMREKLHDQGPDNAAIPDADSDRLPDDWETAWFSTTTTATALSGDDDSDTFTNLEEYVAGSNPNNSLVTPDDLDGDGLADAWETIWFANITAQNGAGDPDGDGLTNEQEETGNSNPTDDEDGLLAAWEIFFFGSTTTQNGTDDSDGDGVSNLDEHLVSQPNNILSTPTDVNGDGIADTLQHKLAAGDALGSTSFNAGLNWNDTLAPAAGQIYINSIGDLRTPAVDGSYTFAGDRLDLVEVYTGLPQLLIKGVGTVTFPLLTLNGGVIQHAATVNSTCRVAGAVDVRGPVRSALSANNGPLAVDAVISGSGNLELWAAGAVTLTAVNTYTGNVKANGGGLVLDTTGSLKFAPAATGVNNAISGTAPVTLNGAFNIDLTGASSTIGDSWDLVTTTGTITIGSTFTVTGFTATGTVGTRLWRSGTYQFDEATGILSVSANPDGDADGMDDAWETTYFGGTAQGAADDFDADGTDNLTEYRLGLVPNNGTSVFAATRNETTGQLTWPSKEGGTFRIERSDSLGAWTVLEAAFPAAVGTTTTYTPPAFASDKAFYRVGLNP